MLPHISFFLALVSLLWGIGSAEAETVTDYLRAFHANPAQTMQRLPSVVDETGEARPQGYIDEALVEKNFAYRKAVRAKIMGRRLDTAIIGGDSPNSKDLPERLVDPGTPLVRNLQEMDARKLTRAALPQLPWADSYWPMYKGLIAFRYADKLEPKSKKWVDYYEYARANPPVAVLASGDPAAIDKLSPAEKYDFVLGDSAFTLTNFSWATGERHFRETGAVATWMGICHGWSGAAHMQAALPAGAVQVIAANGTPVTFHPQDVKALQSMLWANASPSTRFVGNRCDTPRPPKNPRGRILDAGCFDANPATWHLALVNQLAVNQRSFVMDSTYDAQVWNFAVVNYKYRYFNPQSLLEVASLPEAAVPVERFSLDKFREFRTPGTRYIVGVAMDVAHVNAINPTRGRNADIPLKTVRFFYDLELDENFNVLGGEWYSNAHPDFLWTFDKTAQAMTAEDARLANDDWSLTTPVPAIWAGSAQKASARGAPLYSFLRRLVSAGVTPGPAPENPERGGGRVLGERRIGEVQ